MLILHHILFAMQFIVESSRKSTAWVFARPSSENTFFGKTTTWTFSLAVLEWEMASSLTEVGHEEKCPSNHSDKCNNQQDKYHQRPCKKVSQMMCLVVAFVPILVNCIVSVFSFFVLSLIQKAIPLSNATQQQTVYAVFILQKLGDCCEPMWKESYCFILALFFVRNS